MGITERTSGDLLIERTDRLVMVTFNRPAARNALTLDMYDQLFQLCAELRNDSSARVVVFTGEGNRAFAAGTVIAEFEGSDELSHSLGVEARSAKAINAVASVPQVTLAVLGGTAAGGGLALALACDIRVGADTAKVGFPIGATLGNALSVQMTDLLVRSLGEPMARTMLLSAAMVPLTRLESLGAVAWTCAGDQLPERAADFAAKMAYLSPGTQAATKTVLATLAGEADVVEGEQAVTATYASDDFRHAVKTFLGGSKDINFSAELPRAQREVRATPRAPR